MSKRRMLSETKVVLKIELCRGVIMKEKIIYKAYKQGWLSGFDFSVLMHEFLISEGGYVIDTGNYENVNAEVVLRLAEKIKKHPKLWQ